MIISTDIKPCTLCDFSFNVCYPDYNLEGMAYCKYCRVGTVPFAWAQVKECNPLSCIRKDCNQA